MNNVDTEEAVLGCILHGGPESYFSTNAMLSPDTFTDDKCGLIYRACSEIFESGSEHIDKALLYSRLSSQNIQSVSMSDIEQILEKRCSPKSLPSLTGVIRKLEISRIIYDQLRAKAKQVAGVTGHEKLSELLDIVEIDYSQLLTEDTKICNLKDMARELMQRLAENPVDQIGLSSGFPLYDAAIGGGLRDGSVNVIGARMKVGKSTVSSNMAIEICKNLGVKVLYVDTEMLTEEQIHRVMSRLSGVQIKEIETGKFGQNGFSQAKIEKALEELEKMDFYHVNVAGLSFEEHIGIITRWIRQHVKQKPDGTREKFVVVYDYLKMTSSEGITNNIAEHQALGFMITTLHNLSVRYTFPMIALTQLNRDGIDKESTAVVAGSDRILCLCTSFALLKNKSREEIEIDGSENGTKKLVVLLARHGPGLGDRDYIHLAEYKGTFVLKELGLKSKTDEQRAASQNRSSVQQQH